MPKNHESPGRPSPKCENQQARGAVRLHAAAVSRFAKRIRQLVSAAYAAHGGAEHMSLDAWRDVEHELKQRLENELQQPQ